ncbi:MAG: hypothetical protein IKN94_09755 [Salinivirgaceae bacterium]|nr:hypothetical protein [Salinivirgaceae bacterium]
MQTKNLIKIIKAEATVLVSMIESLPDDGDIQPFAIEMLQSKIRDLNNIAVHLSSVGADAANDDNAAAIAAQEAARKAAEEEEARLFAEAEAEAAKRAEELEAARKAAEEAQRIAAQKAADEAARKAAAEEEARRIAAEEARKAEENARRIAAEEASRKAKEEEARRFAEAEAARKAAEEEAKKAKSLADMFADNTADVEQTYNAENEQQPAASATTEPTKTESKPSTLAERFQQNTPSVNDVLAGLEKKANLASRFNSRPITNLRKAIKINDRIRFVNELFDRDSIQYEQTIDMIESSANINEALDKLFSSRNWNQEDETTVDFLELVYQRFKS